jgi:hypothetical protein
MKRHAPLIALVLLALTFAGCSKHSPNTTATNQKVTNLGIIEVSDGVQSRYDLGGGRVCVITPAIQKDGNILLSMRVEESGKLLQQMRAQTRSDIGFQMTVGDISIGMTPHLKQ